jgi:hypothetical protein
VRNADGTRRGVGCLSSPLSVVRCAEEHSRFFANDDLGLPSRLTHGKNEMYFWPPGAVSVHPLRLQPRDTLHRFVPHWSAVTTLRCRYELAAQTLSAAWLSRVMEMVAAGKAQIYRSRLSCAAETFRGVLLEHSSGNKSRMRCSICPNDVDSSRLL